MTGEGQGSPGRRREAILRRLDEAGLDGLLLTHPPNLRYLSGFTGSAGMLLLSRDGAVLVTDGRYAEQADREVAVGVQVVVSREGLPAAVSEVTGARGLETVGVESLHLTLKGLDRLREEGPETGWTGVEGWVEEERSRKDADEVEVIGRAGELADEILEGFVAAFRPGATERELAAWLEGRLRTGGSEGSAFPSIVASGPNSALPHARPTDRAVEEGDLLLVDFGAVVEGYCSDVTRTFVVGEPRPWQEELHAAVREAQERALEAVEAGARASEVDRAAREVLDGAGYGEAFSHSTGHGLGLEVHEAPRLHRTSSERLEAGHVVTVEPGAYLADRGGVRIEDDVAVEAGGTRRLTTFSRELMEL